jgi:hypothetical protein
MRQSHSSIPDDRATIVLMRPRPRSPPHPTASPNLCVATILSQCAALSLDPRTKPRNFYFCLDALMAWGDRRGYERCVVIGMPLDCLFHLRDQFSSGYPYGSASSPPLARIEYRHRDGGDTTCPMHRTPLLRLPFPSHFGPGTASNDPSSVRKCP